jgi:hypothetical protein
MKWTREWCLHLLLFVLSLRKKSTGTSTCCVLWDGTLADGGQKDRHNEMDLLILVYGYSINYLGPCRISLQCSLATDVQS